MGPNLTLIYYTANRISEHFGAQVRDRLLSVCLSRYPHHPRIVVVSHKVTTFPCNAQSALIVVGDVPPCIWQVYQNIYLGVLAATTPYVAMAEDDTLYVPEHFTFCPPRDDTFYYNRHRYVLTRRLSADGKRREAYYYFRERHQMAMCFAPRALLVETLEEKFAKYPAPIPDDEAKHTGWGEPGRYEKHLGLAPRKMEWFSTADPCVTINHSRGLMGRRAPHVNDRTCADLQPWGNADELWERICGNGA